MNLSRRDVLKASALAPLYGHLPGTAFAQSSSTLAGKQLRFVVPASPGTVLDVTARFMAEPLGQQLGASVIVDSRVGANGIIGTDYVAKSAPDGTALLFTAVHHFTNRWIAESPLPYDPVRDFAPIARLTSAVSMVLVPANSPYKNLMELVRDMKARPGEITYASAGNGSTTHLCTALLNDLTQTSARHIPYKGAAGAVTDVVGGQVSFTCQSTATAMSLVKAGRIRPLAVTSGRRLESMPEIPTVAEAGVPGYEAISWVGVMAPAATPDSLVQRLSDAFVKAATAPAFKQFCDAQSLTVDAADTRTFRAEIPADVERWRKVVETLKKT